MDSSAALTLLAARLGAAVYDSAFLASGVIDLTPFSRRVVARIWANDPRVGRVLHGVISEYAGLESSNYHPVFAIWSMAGTLIPPAKTLLQRFTEWLDDFDAWLMPSPWNPGDKIHRGFYTFYSAVTIEHLGNGQEYAVRDYMKAWPTLVDGALFEGHSLATSSADYLLMDAVDLGLKPIGVINFAPPKSGDLAFRKSVIETIQNLDGIYEAWANPNDAVPCLPLTVTRPFKVWDFEHVVEPVDLAADLVTPAIPSDWESSHHMLSYLALITAHFATPPVSP
jgi:Lipase (class 3)